MKTFLKCKMASKKFLPLIYFISLLVLFILGFYYNLVSQEWAYFFIIAMILIFIGFVLSIFFGTNENVSRHFLLGPIMFVIYILIIFIGIRYLFLYISLESFTYIIEHYLLIIFFLINFLIALREIFLILYSGKGTG